MDLIAFRVTMYKGIIDSGWIDVNDLTVLVGKNESGKTSLLKVLHKFNPYNPDSDENTPDLYDENDPDSYKGKPNSYQIDWEWPRARLHEQNQEQVVCCAKFRLSDQEKSDLAQIAPVNKMPNTVEVSRNYAGQLEINFGEDILSNIPPPNDIDIIFSELPEIRDEFGDQFKQSAYECLREARELASKERLSEFSELAHRHQQLLREAVSPSDPPQQIESAFIDNYYIGLEDVMVRLTGFFSIQSKIHDYITDRLPTFIYMRGVHISLLEHSSHMRDIASR